MITRLIDDDKGWYDSLLPAEIILNRGQPKRVGQATVGGRKAVAGPLCHSDIDFRIFEHEDTYLPIR